MRSLNFSRNVNTHPVVKRVTEGWGDILGTSVEAEREFESGVVYRSGRMRLTDKYAIVNGFFSFDIFRFQDLVWAYKRVIQRRVNFIPAGKSYEAALNFYGGRSRFAASEKKVDEVIAYAGARAPWATVGYSKELEEYFKKNTQEFCRRVEAKRHELAASPSRS